MNSEMKLPDSKNLRLEIWELLRLEFDIEQDIKKMQEDLERIQEQRRLLETQLKLMKDGRLGKQDDERIN